MVLLVWSYVFVGDYWMHPTVSRSLWSAHAESLSHLTSARCYQIKIFFFLNRIECLCHCTNVQRNWVCHRRVKPLCTCAPLLLGTAAQGRPMLTFSVIKAKSYEELKGNVEDNQRMWSEMHQPCSPLKKTKPATMSPWSEYKYCIRSQTETNKKKPVSHHLVMQQTALQYIQQDSLQ